MRPGKNLSAFGGRGTTQMVIFAGISGLTDADGDEADGPTERAEGRYCLFLDYTDCANIIRQSREGRAARRKGQVPRTRDWEEALVK